MYIAFRKYYTYFRKFMIILLNAHEIYTIMKTTLKLNIKNHIL